MWSTKCDILRNSVLPNGLLVSLFPANSTMHRFDFYFIFLSKEVSVDFFVFVSCATCQDVTYCLSCASCLSIACSFCRNMGDWVTIDEQKYCLLCHKRNNSRSTMTLMQLALKPKTLANYKIKNKKK